MLIYRSSKIIAHSESIFNTSITSFLIKFWWYVVILNAKRIEDENLLTFRIFQFDVVFSLVQKNLHLRQAMFPRRGGQEATSVPPFAGKIVLEVCGNE